ncbi:hypothetical protein GCM10010439_10930 [Actinocorallia aurantiaca]|uniref:Uncharacterized protein n=1 Tax=Actinocorallia aurantiaca TaxID=46204 RepID=A0ABN3U061_9ACTN
MKDARISLSVKALMVLKSTHPRNPSKWLFRQVGACAVRGGPVTRRSEGSRGIDAAVAVARGLRGPHQALSIWSAAPGRKSGSEAVRDGAGQGVAAFRIHRVGQEDGAWDMKNRS